MFSGEEADIEEAPWIVNIGGSCTGVIISDQAVLTAAHCFKDADSKKIKVGTASYKKQKRSQIYKIKKAIPNPLFHDDGTDLFADIGILITEEPIEFSDNVQPICILSGKMDNMTEQVKVYGFGLVTDFITEWRKYHGNETNLKQNETVTSNDLLDLLEKMERGADTQLKEVEIKDKLNSTFNKLFPGIGDLEKVILKGKLSTELESQIEKKLLEPINKSDTGYKETASALKGGLRKFQSLIKNFKLPKGSKINRFWQIIEMLFNVDEDTPLFYSIETTNLKAATYSIISTADCAREHLDVEASALCLKSNSSICSGDSGGPAVIIRDDKQVLLGVTSYSLIEDFVFPDFCNCNCVESPTFVTRVDLYADWILETLREEKVSAPELC